MVATKGIVMSETPRAPSSAGQEAGTSQVPGQTRGQERVTPQEAPPAQHRAEAPPEPTGWVGWIIFASIMMILVGTFSAIDGLAALFRSGYYVVGRNGLLVNVDYTVWGWAHLVVGVVAIVAAFGLLAGKTWGRVLGIAIAMLSALVNLAFMAAYPVWALTLITLDVVVIYAIAMHGAELKARQPSAM